MTPAESITRRLVARIESAGATLPIQSLLVEALEGARHSAPSSGIVVNVSVASQLHEPLPLYSISVSIALSVAIDDDKGGSLFKANHDALWSALDFLARCDNCAELGSADFAVDGFQLGSADPPEYQDDAHGGSWTVVFSATVTGRAR